MNEALLLGDFVQADEPYTIRYYDGDAYYEHGNVRARDVAHLMRASGRFYRDGSDSVEISIDCHRILSYTPCGVWVATWEGKKFVNLRASKQWASVTEAEAIDQLYYRKRTQVRILESRLVEAKGVLAVLEKHFDKKPPARRPYCGGYDY